MQNQFTPNISDTTNPQATTIRRIRPLSYYSNHLRSLQQQEQSQHHSQQIGILNNPLATSASTTHSSRISLSPFHSTRPLRSASTARHSGDHTDPSLNKLRSNSTSPKKNDHSNNDSNIIDMTEITSNEQINQILGQNDQNLRQDDDSDTDSISTTSQSTVAQTKNKHRYNPKQRKKVIIITGGTAVGKTSLSIELAKKLNGEIVSADSMQIYSHFDTGTAKIGLDETDGIPHHLVDIVPSGGTDFSSSMFYQSATEIINNIVSRKKTPILVGGTGLYLRWLLYGRPQGMSITPDQSSRTVCINHYMSSLTKGLIGWEKSVGAGKGVGKTQQVTHTENLYKFQQPENIPFGKDLIRVRGDELNQILELYPSTFYKDSYDKNDLINELIINELQHICISNQIRWAMIDKDGFEKNSNQLHHHHLQSQSDYPNQPSDNKYQRYHKVNGVRTTGLDNSNAFLPEFQSIPFIDTLHGLYTTYLDNHSDTIDQDEHTALGVIRGLFLDPTIINFGTQNATSTNNQQEQFQIFQNDHPFPLDYNSSQQMISNADFSFHFYRIYTSLQFKAYGKNVAETVRDLFIDWDGYGNENNRHQGQRRQNSEDSDQFSFVYNQSEITADNIHSHYNTANKPIPVVEHNGNYYTPRLLQFEGEKNVDNIPRFGHEHNNSTSIDAITTEMMEVLNAFGQTKIPKRLIKDYITLVLTTLDQQYQQVKTYRRFLQVAQKDFIKNELEKGLTITQLINGGGSAPTKDQYHQYSNGNLSQDEINLEKQYQEQLNDDFLLTDKNNISQNSSQNHQNTEKTENQSATSSDPAPTPTTTTTTIHHPHSRQSLHAHLCRMSLTDHISQLQDSNNLFTLTMTSFYKQREKLMLDTKELTQTIDNSLEDPFNLKNKYHKYADYRHISTIGQTNSSTQSVDSLLGMFYFGFDDPHSLPPISSPQDLTEPIGKSQLEKYTKTNKAMIQQGIGFIRDGIAKKIPHKMIGTMTTNTIYTIVPTLPSQSSSTTSPSHISNPTDNRPSQFRQEYTNQDGNIHTLPYGSLTPGLYKCPNDIVIKVQYKTPELTLKAPPQTSIHPLNSLIFQNRLLFSKFKLPAMAWVESHRYNNDLYRLEKSLCHALVTGGFAIPPKYKDQMNTEPLERLAGRIPWDDDQIEGGNGDFDDDDFWDQTSPNPSQNRNLTLYNPSTANSEGLINHYDVRCYFLHTHRNLHYRLADFRCEQMVRGGMLKETLLLLNTYNASNAAMPYPVPNSTSNTGPTSMQNPNDGGVRGLWPTSPNFDYFMRNDIDGYLKRYFPHPHQNEPQLLLSDTTNINEKAIESSGNLNKGQNGQNNGEENELTPKDQQKLHQQQLTSEWLYMDELMFTYRQVALPFMVQLFDITHTMIKQGLIANENQNDENNNEVAITNSQKKSKKSQFVIYHNQYKHQYLDTNFVNLSSSDVYNSNSLTTLTYSIHERSLAYLGYLIEFPEKIDEMFQHCKFTQNDLEHLSELITASVSTPEVVKRIESKGRVMDMRIGMMDNQKNDQNNKKKETKIDPRTAIISMATTCMQIERQMVTYAPIKNTSGDNENPKQGEYSEEIDTSQLQDFLTPMLRQLLGLNLENNEFFLSKDEKTSKNSSEKNVEINPQTKILLPKLLTLLTTAGIPLDYSTRSNLLEYDFSITDSYNTQKATQVEQFSEEDDKNNRNDENPTEKNSNSIDKLPQTFTQHLYNYQIYNDNTSPLYRFVTGHSGKDFKNQISQKDKNDSRLTDTIIKSNKQTILTVLPCEHLITLPKIKLIQHALPDAPYSTTSQNDEPIQNEEITELTTVSTTSSTQLQSSQVTKPVNINPLANTVISLFSPRVKSIGYTNILGFFTDSSISALFSKWNSLMAEKEQERDRRYTQELISKIKLHRESKVRKNDQNTTPESTEKETVHSTINPDQESESSERSPLVSRTASTPINDFREAIETTQTEALAETDPTESSSPKKVKIPAVMALSIDGDSYLEKGTGIRGSNGDSTTEKVELWKPKIFISTSKDKSHHFLPTIGLSADITIPTAVGDDVLPHPTLNKQQLQQQQSRKAKGQQQQRPAKQKETASSRLPWNTDLKMKEELLGTIYPINTSFVDGVKKIQSQHLGGNGYHNLSHVVEADNDNLKNNINNIDPNTNDLNSLVSMARSDGIILPHKPPVSISIADLRTVITPQFINQFTSLLGDFQTSTRGYIKRQHTFFQDEPICQLVTIPFENIPTMMSNHDFGTFRLYQDSVHEYLKGVGATYDGLLEAQYEQMKIKYDAEVAEKKQLLLHQEKQLSQQQKTTNTKTNTISHQADLSSSSGSDINSDSESSSSSLSSLSTTSSTISSTNSYPFSFPRSLNFNLLTPEKFVVRDVQFNQIHVGAYYKEFMYQYIPHHVKKSIANLQFNDEHEDTTFANFDPSSNQTSTTPNNTQNQNDTNNTSLTTASNFNYNPYTTNDHPTFLFGPSHHTQYNNGDAPIGDNNTINNDNGTTQTPMVVIAPTNHSKHPLRRAMPVVYDFSNTQYTLPVPLSPSVAPLLVDNPDHKQHQQRPKPTNNSTLGLYKYNLGRVIDEITQDITTKPQGLYWESMLQRHERRQLNLPPVKSYPFTTLSPIPPLMDSCIDLTSYQGQLQLFWNDGAVLETVLDLFEFQRGLSLLKQPLTTPQSPISSLKSQDMPLDTEIFNYFSHHKTVLKQDVMSTRLFDNDNQSFIIPHGDESDSAAALSLSSPINNQNADTSTTPSAQTITNVQSVRQHGISTPSPSTIDLSTQRSHSTADNSRVGQRVGYPWHNFVQLNNNELLAAKHSY